MADYFKTIKKTPEFFKEYEGKYIVDNNKRYKISGGKATEFDIEAENQKWLASQGIKHGQYGSGAFTQGVMANEFAVGPTGLDWDRKLGDTAKLGYRYIDQASEGYQKASAGNFGLGTGGTFRPRGAGETMADYLRAKQSAGIGGVQVGNQVDGGSPATMGVTRNPLKPSQYDAIRKQYGVSEANFDKFFERDGINIYLKSDAPLGGNLSGVGDVTGGDLGLGNIGAGGLVSGGGSTQNIGSFASGAMNNVSNAKSQLNDFYKKQLEKYEKQSADLQAKMDALTSKQEGALGDVESLLQPFRAQLEESERQRLKIEENFFANQNAVGEMETLLTQINEDLQGARGVTGLRSIREPRISKMVEQATARVGILEAVIALRNNQITTGTVLIDRTVNAMNADRNEKIDYYNSLLSFYDGQKKDIKDLLSNSIGSQKDIINAQIDVLKSDVEQSEAISNYVKELMLDPETASMMQGAGITLADSIETINAKMAKYIQDNPQAGDVKTSIQTINGRKISIATDAQGNVVNRVDLGSSTSGGGGINLSKYSNLSDEEFTLAYLSPHAALVDDKEKGIEEGDLNLSKVEESALIEARRRNLIDEEKEEQQQNNGVSIWDIIKSQFGVRGL